MSKYKVLIGGPIHKIKEYSIPTWGKHLNQLHCAPDGSTSIVKYMIDTTPKEHNWKCPSIPGIIYHKLDIDETVIPKAERVHNRLVVAQNYMRDIVLQNDFTHFFSVECDVLVPSWGLDKLLAADKPLIEGQYYPKFYPDEWWGGKSDDIHEVSPRGTMGCCLIKREVLEHIDFRYETELVACCSDGFFHFDAHKLGFNSYVHCGVQCEHMHDQFNFRGWQFLKLEPEPTPPIAKKG